MLRHLAFAPALLAAPQLLANTTSSPASTARVQYSVNAYSFHKEFQSGAMNFFDMMEFASDIGLNAVDLTAYYFSTYPDIPKPEELFALKKRALELGLNISWTGVRNNFVTSDTEARKADQQMIRHWLDVSAILGASIMRVFTGRNAPKNCTKEQVKAWLVEEYKACARYGAEKGIVVALQNHNEFLYEAEDVLDILQRVGSDWFGLILDISGLRTQSDPYAEAEKLAPYASYWFIKEHVYHSQEKTPVDMGRMASLIKRNNYRGYISFESLSDGDPKEIVASMVDSFKMAYTRA